MVAITRAAAKRAIRFTPIPFAIIRPVIHKREPSPLDLSPPRPASPSSVSDVIAVSNLTSVASAAYAGIDTAAIGVPRQQSLAHRAESTESEPTVKQEDDDRYPPARTNGWCYTALDDYYRHRSPIAPTASPLLSRRSEEYRPDEYEPYHPEYPEYRPTSPHYGSGPAHTARFTTPEPVYENPYEGLTFSGQATVEPHQGYYRIQQYANGKWYSYEPENLSISVTFF
jgi:hypothetical protein